MDRFQLSRASLQRVGDKRMKQMKDKINDKIKEEKTSKLSKASSETPDEVLRQIMYDIDTNRQFVKEGTVAYRYEAMEKKIPGTNKTCKFGDTFTLKEIVTKYLLNKNVKYLKEYRQKMREYLNAFFVNPIFEPLT